MDNGIAYVKIDDKGRFIFPKQMRSILEEEDYIMTFSLDKCLQLIPLKDFKEMKSKIINNTQHPQMKEAARKMLFRIVGPATDVVLDKSSRLCLTKPFREIPNLFRNTEAVVIFYGSYFEIWSSIEYLNSMNTTDYQAASDIIFGGE